MLIRTRNIQSKVRDDFYNDLQNLADHYDMSISALVAFALRQWMDAQSQSNQIEILQKIIEQNPPKKVD